MSKRSHIKKRMAAAGLAAGLLGGGIAGAAFTGNAIGAGAQTGTPAESTIAPSDTAQTLPATRPDPTRRLTEILKPLVDQGTIDQAQSDAVVAALTAAGPMGRHEGPDGPGGPGGHEGPGGRHRGPGLEAAAKALGVSADELRTSLLTGKSIAEVATSNNVDVNVVIDAMVNDLTSHLADEVKAGHLTQADADQRIADATERITQHVNEPMPTRPADAGPDGGPNAN
jgi:hypothetical protein